MNDKLVKIFYVILKRIYKKIIDNIFKIVFYSMYFIALMPIFIYYVFNIHYIPNLELKDVFIYLVSSFFVVMIGVLLVYILHEGSYLISISSAKGFIDKAFKFLTLATSLLSFGFLCVFILSSNDDDLIVLTILIMLAILFIVFPIIKNQYFKRIWFLISSILILSNSNFSVVKILGIGNYYADVELDSNYVKTKIILSKLDDSQIDKTYIEDNKVIVKNIKVLNSAGDELLLQVESKDKTIKYKPLRFNKKYADIL